MRWFLFAFALFVLLAAEILRVYFIMPFPGSQRNETIEVAYFIGLHINLFRIAGLLLIAYPTYYFIVSGSRRIMLTAMAGLMAWLVVAYLFNFRFLADKMFHQPERKLFLNAAENKVKAHQLVLGIDINGQAKAYAIEIIGYHHQVRDTVGGKPVMVTYCTVCRTGRVYAPQVDGIPEDFRLVGMDHFNAMFEDSRTKSWWRQANGEAVVGPLKGKFINEIHSEQMRLDAWINQHPNTLVMQPDSLFIEEYEGLKNYDEGKSTGELTKPDSLSWKDKSWVVGVPMGLHSKAYDWNDLKDLRAINDELAGVSLLIVLENDTASFHVFQRDTLTFRYDLGKGILTDANTQSHWKWSGECIEGKLLGAKLRKVQSYQEFWHSWKTFHPNTIEFHPE